MRTVAVIAALLASGCMADLELGAPEVSAVCLNDAPLAFAGGDERAIIDLEPLDLEAPEGWWVTLDSATMTAVTGVGDLGFADHVRVVLLDTAEGDVVLADAVVSGGVIELDGDPTLELGAYLRTGADRIEIAVEGEMPPDRWTAEVDICFEID